MTHVKIYRVSGRIVKAHLFEPITFKKDIVAAKENHAIEKIFAEMGSCHRAKRHQIKILSVEVVELEEGE